MSTRQKIPYLLLLPCLAVLLSGCIISIGSRRKCPPQQPPVEVAMADLCPTIAEINAVSKLSLETDKERFYVKIASRPGLSEPAQVALVKAAYRNLRLETSKERLLLAIIGNPNFAPAAKSEILRDLSKLHLETSKTRVLDAISKRGNLAPQVVVVEETVEIVEKN